MADRILVATRKGLFQIERAAPGRWKVARGHFVGDNVCMVLADPRHGVWYACLHHGHFGTKLHRSHDEGASWEEIGVPAYPPKPEGEVDLDPWRKTPREWRLEQVWSLEAGHPSQPGVLWCGTLPGGLFRSSDSGATWELVRSLWDNPKRKEWFGGGMDQPGIHSICLDPRDPASLVVGVSCGGVWGTKDGGESWECMATGMRAAYLPPERADDPNTQDPHCVARCPGQPDYLWAQHHNGVFRSTDNSQLWQEIPEIAPSSFGFAVAVHPQDGNTAWLVPAIRDEKRIPVDGKVVVTRTRDGGKTFDILREGLPQENAYDLTFRHALDVDGTGDRLAFGSTTGSLWVSENQGDSWTTVSEHLPPVYTVRFA